MNQDKPLLDVSALAAELERFAQARDWQQYHSPKNLAMAVAGEVGELIEIFQWLTEAQSHEVARNPATAEHVRDEIADVFIYLVRLSQALGVDLDAAVRAKMVKNGVKYPVPHATAATQPP